MNFYWHILILLFLYCKQSLLTGNLLTTRHKRHLMYPFGGTFKLVIGIAVPVEVGPKQTLACGLNFQYQFALPRNITQFEKPYPPILGRKRRRRRKRDDDRSTTELSEKAIFYSGIEEVLNRYGVNGKACLLKTICDNAMYSLNHQSNGLYGELLDIALTPQDTEEVPNLDSQYIDAWKAGIYGVDCNSLYLDCPPGYGILDFISVLDY